MIPRRQSSGRPGPVNEARLTASLRRTGLSSIGIRQALEGRIVSDASDRATIARILLGFASLPPCTGLEVYDYVGGYTLN